MPLSILQLFKTKRIFHQLNQVSQLRKKSEVSPGRVGFFYFTVNSSIPHIRSVLLFFFLILKNGPDGWTRMDGRPLFIATEGINARQPRKAFGFGLCLSDVPWHSYYRRLANSCCSRHYTRIQSGPSLEMAAVCESDTVLKTHQLADIAPHPPPGANYPPNRICCTRYPEAQSRKT